MTDTEKINAAAAEAVRKQREAEKRAALGKRVNTDDLPLTRGQLRLGWAFVAVFGGFVLTGAGYLWTTATSAESQRNAIVANTQDIATLMEWKKERTRDGTRFEVEVARALSAIDTKLGNLTEQIAELRAERGQRRHRP